MRFKDIATQCVNNQIFINRRIEESRNKLNKETYNSIIQKIEATHSSKGPLLGLLFAVKDNLAIKDRNASLGIKPPLLQINNESAWIIKKLESLGANLIAATNLDPLALGASGRNPYYGDVKNPNYPSEPVGGSSAGSAAIVAANICDFSLGSDHGGSVRIPAACCDLVGFKMSPNLIPKDGCLFLESPLDCLGILTKCCSDLHFLLSNILGKVIQPTNNRDIKILLPMSEEIIFENIAQRKLFNNLVDKLAKHISIIQLREPIGFEEAQEVRKLLLPNILRNYIKKYNIPQESLNNETLALLKLTKDFSTFSEAEKQKKRIKEKFQSTISKYDGACMLIPALTCAPQFLLKHEKTINFYFSLANITDSPALVLPCKIEHSRIPLQIVGLESKDLELIQCGLLLEAQLNSHSFQQPAT